jgi:hypothetical protein
MTSTHPARDGNSRKRLVNRTLIAVVATAALAGGMGSVALAGGLYHHRDPSCQQGYGRECTSEPASNPRCKPQSNVSSMPGSEAQSNPRCKPQSDVNSMPDSQVMALR